MVTKYDYVSVVMFSLMWVCIVAMAFMTCIGL